MHNRARNWDRKQFLQRLKEMFCSLDGGKNDPAERRGGILPGFGWTESEAEYQEAQAAWLQGRGSSRRYRGARASGVDDETGGEERD